MAQRWHSCGMPRVRVSTTVDHDLLEEARARTPGLNDAALLDAALKALVDRHRAVEIDSAYAAYDERPLDEPDAWGDLASFRDAAGAP
jgi:post-segregation antitoxin (ccd killing protein)